MDRVLNQTVFGRYGKDGVPVPKLVTQAPEQGSDNPTTRRHLLLDDIVLGT
ncbi:hypothetical protein DPMN_029546 [Dreissena polymorpha]|uniref:Uncharacterized protein n=1 Tax=Dreissena polymorpha TaxID=45954 RepID=A0A9D4LWN7_DREPO|nr:hypothetical protein DPMN_029546 [Dreissena polymorpha]